MYTECCNIKKLRFTTQYICVFHTILEVNTDCFRKVHWLIGLCNRDELCSLLGKK